MPVPQIAPTDLLTQLAARGLSRWWQMPEKSAWQAFGAEIYRESVGKRQ